MHFVPRLRFSRDEIRAGIERRELIGTLVIGLRLPDPVNSADARKAVFPIQGHTRMPDRIARLIEDFSAQHRDRIKAEDETFRIQTSTSDDCGREDRKSTRLNSSHMSISYAVFCLKKKKKKQEKNTLK